MDQLTTYRQIIRAELEERSTYSLVDEKDRFHQLIVDEEQNHFLLLSMGWSDGLYHDYIVFHIEIKDDKVWIHQDNTDVGIAAILSEQGISKSCIVLAYFPEHARALSEYAVA
jgi:hypothetical protein